jgi:hypothetical protein
MSSCHAALRGHSALAGTDALFFKEKVRLMHSWKKSERSRVQLRYRMLATAAFSTLSATGLTQAALMPKVEPPVQIGSIGYLGPIPSQPTTVATGNTFDIAVVGFGSGPTDAGYLVGPFTATFGTTLTETKATIDGQTATVTSTETASKGITTDNITFSVPTRFAPVGQTFPNGDPIIDEEVDIGGNAGASGLTFSLPVTTAINGSGTAIYNYGGTGELTFSTADGSLYTELNSTDTMLSAAEGVYAGGSDITVANFSSFSFSFSYATPVAAVPEPGTAAVGLILGVGLLRGRNRRKNQSSPLVDLSTGLV